MRRLLILLSVLMLAMSAALAEDAPLTLRSATTVEEVEQFLLLPPEDGVAEVKRGYIRYISQSEKRDTSFRKEYWLGGEEGGILDLTRTERYGVKFDFHTGVMCTRAAYSMILSYFGIDMSPGKMSEVTGRRNLYEPYTEISDMFGLELNRGGRLQFDQMMQNYLTDDSYSPVYLYFRKPNGVNHAMIVVGYMPDPGRYLVIDSSPYWVHGVPYRTFFVSMNKKRTIFINSTFYDELVNSELLQVWQWRLPPEAEAALQASSETE